ARAFRIRMTFPQTVAVPLVEAAVAEVLARLPQTSLNVPAPHLEVADISERTWDGVVVDWTENINEGAIRDQILRSVLASLPSGRPARCNPAAADSLNPPVARGGREGTHGPSSDVDPRGRDRTRGHERRPPRRRGDGRLPRVGGRGGRREGDPGVRLTPAGRGAPVDPKEPPGAQRSHHDADRRRVP